MWAPSGDQVEVKALPNKPISGDEHTLTPHSGKAQCRESLRSLTLGFNLAPTARLNGGTLYPPMDRSQLVTGKDVVREDVVKN